MKSANGLYEDIGTYLTRRYYLNNDTSCGDPLPDGNYLYFKVSKWRLGIRNPNADDLNLINGSIGQCDSTANVITACDGIWAIPSTTVDPKIEVIQDMCPSWTGKCAQISIDIPTSSNDQCAGTFTKNTNFDYDNVYSKVSGSTTTYWYFNHKAWEWICSEMVDFRNCKAIGSDILHKTDSSQYWQDINLQQNIQINTTTGVKINVGCLATNDPTPSPTSNPLPPGDGRDDVRMIYLGINVFSLIVFVYNVM